ncbi:hypothetical protein RCL1_004546 [Eukaryota sp. TZLM3-RCL]
MRGITIDNIPWWTTESNLRHEFSAFGTITFLQSFPENTVYIEYHTEEQLMLCMNNCNKNAAGLFRTVRMSDRPDTAAVIKRNQPKKKQIPSKEKRPNERHQVHDARSQFSASSLQSMRTAPQNGQADLMNLFDPNPVLPMPVHLTFLESSPSAQFPPRPAQSNPKPSPKKPNKKGKNQLNNTPLRPSVLVQGLHPSTDINEVKRVLSEFGEVTSSPTLGRNSNGSLYGSFRFVVNKGAAQAKKALEAAQNAALALDRSTTLLPCSSGQGVRVLVNSLAKVKLSNIPRSFNEAQIAEYFADFGAVGHITHFGRNATVSFVDWDVYNNVLQRTDHPFTVVKFEKKSKKQGKSMKTTPKKQRNSVTSIASAPSEEGSVHDSDGDDLWVDMSDDDDEDSGVE